MKKIFLSCLLVAVTSFGFLSAQTFEIPPAGKYKMNKKRLESTGIAPVPVRIDASIVRVEKDFMEIGVDWEGRGSYYGSTYSYARLKDNVFAQTENGYFVTPIEDFVVLRPNSVLDIYNLSPSQDEIVEILVMAIDGSKWKGLKKAADASSQSFPLADMVAAVPAWNDAKKAKMEEEEKAKEAEKQRLAAEKKAAQEKAAAERKAVAEAKAAAAKAERENADLCTAFQRYFKMASSNFSEIKGKLDPEETEMEEEDVFFTTETPPLFVVGRLMPNLFDPNKKEFAIDTKQFSSKAQAQAELEFIKTKLTCFSSKTGYKVYEDSGLHFYEKGSLKFYLFTKMDYDTDNYYVQLKMKK